MESFWPTQSHNHQTVSACPRGQRHYIESFTNLQLCGQQSNSEHLSATGSKYMSGHTHANSGLDLTSVLLARLAGPGSLLTVGVSAHTCPHAHTYVQMYERSSSLDVPFRQMSQETVELMEEKMIFKEGNSVSGRTNLTDTNRLTKRLIPAISSPAKKIFYNLYLSKRTSTSAFKK